MSNEKNTLSFTANKNLSPKLVQKNSFRIRIKFKGMCLKQDNVTFTGNIVVNLFIAYELDRWSKDLNANFTLNDGLFGAVKITQNAHPDKYSYSGQGIGFHSCSVFPVPNFK